MPLRSLTHSLRWEANFRLLPSISKPPTTIERSPEPPPAPVRCCGNLRWEGWPQKRVFFPLLTNSQSQPVFRHFRTNLPLISSACTQTFWVGLLVSISILCLSVRSWTPRWTYSHHRHSICYRPEGNKDIHWFFSSPGFAFSMSTAPTLATWGVLE